MKLRKNEYCPIHHSRSCCGRKQTHKEHRLRLGVQRIKDLHHPRGYRELRSASEMRKLPNRKIVEQAGKCAICEKEFIEYNDIVPDHKQPKSWEELGEMIILRISKQSIGSAIQERAREGLMTDDRSFDLSLRVSVASTTLSCGGS